MSSLIVSVILVFTLNFRLGQAFFKSNEFKLNDVGYSASAVELQKLVEIEIEIVQALQDFQETHADVREFPSIAKYLSDFKFSLSNSKELSNGVPDASNYSNLSDEVVKNPLSSYLYLRRIVYLFPRVEREVIAHNITGLFQIISKHKAQLPFPTQKNVEESIKSIIRLKYTYNLSISSLIVGNLNGYETGSNLEAEHCYEIGFFASQNNFWSIAIDFYEMSFKLAVQNGWTSTEDISRIKKTLESTIELHDELLRIRMEDLDEDEVSPTLFQKQLKSFDSPEFQTRKEMVANPQILNRQNKIGIEASYESLCRSGEIRTAKATKNLKCHIFRNTTNKYWLIRPLQVEYLNEEPPIMQIYNFMSDAETEALIEYSKSELTRSRYVTGSADSHRTSSSSFISDSDQNSPFFYINQRIESITGLKVTSLASSEDLQVTHYPPGGHYSHHYDCTFDSSVDVSEEILEFGERIATFMIYLSDVELGGNTAFPILGVRALPIKGSALFWYNLLANGDHDSMSLHGGCPVLYSTKWVANKWISANEQMFRRKCLLTKSKEHESSFNFSET